MRATTPPRAISATASATTTPTSGLTIAGSDDTNAAGDLDSTGSLSLVASGRRPTAIDGSGVTPENILAAFASVQAARVHMVHAGNYGIEQEGAGSVRFAIGKI